MDFPLLVRQEHIVDANIQFWKAIEIWLKNPHTVNRRISSFAEILQTRIECNSLDLSSRLNTIDYDSLSKEDSTNELSNLLGIPKDEISDSINLFVKLLLPRNPQLFSPTFEFTFMNKETNTVYYFHKPLTEAKKSLCPAVDYKFHWDGKNTISVYIQKIETPETERTVDWLKNTLFSRFVKWATVENSQDRLTSSSLVLVSSTKYTNLYNKLKEKYAPDLMKIWPECTDPKKFVYEDIAIATYLLLLWEQEREEKGLVELQSFLDLGCGNGLLVYILTNEGHKGTGIDLRRRKIWDYYSHDIDLKVVTIVPSNFNLSPQTDWLIGNHSDELTPWIPVIAARASFACRYFVLPCCAYEFDGKKYQRRNPKSQYCDYLCYIQEISKRCGFNTYIDRLRIPSTKRICLIGKSRTYPIEKTKDQHSTIEGIVNERSKENFKPRNPIERVRNCTQLDKTLISKIVDLVVSELLKTSRLTTTSTGKSWNSGGQLELHRLVEFIPSKLLKELKNECGGLQTLLKNHRDIFQVVDGTVRFRIPGLEDTKKKRIKTRFCWFFHNHPDGCPVEDVRCYFKH